MQALLAQATAQHNRGNLSEAERLYRLVLEKDSHQPDALALLGLVLAARKEYAEAVGLLHRAIMCDPQAPLFRLYLGNMQAEMGDREKAIAALQEALEIEPNFAEAHYSLALLWEKQDCLAQAVNHLQEASRLKPKEGAVWLKLGELSLKTKDFDIAENAARTAVRLLPDSFAARVAYALVLGGLYREEEEITVLREVLEMRPDFAEAWDMLGTACQNLGRLDEAEAAFHKAIACAGGEVLADPDKADESAYRPQHWDLALLELLRGDFKRGFAHYRARFKNPGRPGRPAFPQPVWSGQELAGKKILVVSEQGFGDIFMMCRFAPLLKAKGARVVFLAPAAAAPLIRMAGLADEVISETPSSQGDYDFQTSIFDLPLRFGTTVKTIPSGAPYLPSPWAEGERLPSETTKPKIGVVWRGNKEHGNDRARSLPLSVFAALFAETRAQFYNLTRELADGEEEILRAHNVIDLSQKLPDFLATAGIVAQLDLVITCDTAMAHLAGGMGKKVWTLLPFAPDWRWLLEREDSPWYPSMRLFRQKIKGDWPEAVARAQAALERDFLTLNQDL